MDAGSAANCAMAGAAGGGGGGVGGASTTGGGGGGGGGIFFLQPNANTIKIMVAHTITIFRELSIKHLLLLNYPLLAPNRGLITSLRGELAHLRSVRQHGPDLVRSATRRHKHEMHAVRRPAWILVPSLAVRQLRVRARCHVHGEYVEIPRGVSPRPRVRDDLAAGMPRRIGRLAFAGSQTFHVRSIHIHPVNLLWTGAERL